MESGMQTGFGSTELDASIGLFGLSRQPHSSAAMKTWITSDESERISEWIALA